MGLTIALGRRNLGLTWPNPSVGAVLVSPGEGHRILAQGATAPGGRPHAEPLAIAAASSTAGATLYVSLEPCSHHGRTPPCAEAIVAAGIGRVVTAIEDPDGRVAGNGHAILRAAGITVVTGLRAAEAGTAHRGHISRVLTGRPFLTLKLAQTLDGFAGRRGERLLITSDAANARTHMMRAQADAILVGSNTSLADDPRLDVRLPGLETRRPVRIVLDSSLSLPTSALVVQTVRQQPTWVICTGAAPAGDEARLTEAGVDVIRVPADVHDRPDLGEAMLALGTRGITTLLCEGGPTLADELAAHDLVDEVVLMTGSVTLEAEGAKASIPALGPSLLTALGTRFSRVAAEQVGPDRIKTYERITPCSPAL